MTKQTDDKRLAEIRERHAKRRVDIIFDGTMLADMNADIAFLLGKIGEYEARDGAAEIATARLAEAEWWDKLLGRIHEHADSSKERQAIYAQALARIQSIRFKPEQLSAAPPPQVREAEVERPSDADFKKHLDNLAEKWYAEHGSKVDQRISAAREEGVKAGLQAAMGVPLLSAYNRKQISKLPVTEIASRKE